MPKSNKIRWRASDLAELNRLVKNYNAKIDYWQKKNPEFTESYPEKYRAKELKQLITTRNDFNTVVKKLSRFSERGAEKLITNENGVTLTEYEFKESQKAVKRANMQMRDIRDKMAKMPRKIGGVDAPNVQQKNFEDYAKDFQKPDFDKLKDLKHFRDFSKAVESKMLDTGGERQAQIFFENIKTAISVSHMDSEHKNKCLDIMNKIGYKAVTELYYEGYEEMTVDFWYDDNLGQASKYSRLIKVSYRYLT